MDTAEEGADQLAQRLVRTEKALERAETLALAGRFSATIMHEINGPLEAVTNFAYLLRTGELSHEARTYLDLMDEQLSRLRGNRPPDAGLLPGRAETTACRPHGACRSCASCL